MRPPRKPEVTAIKILGLIFFTIRAVVLLWMTIKLENNPDPNLCSERNSQYHCDVFLHLITVLSVALLITSVLWTSVIIMKERGQSIAGKKIKSLKFALALFLVITTLASLAASTVSFAVMLEEHLTLGIILVSYFPPCIITGWCYGHWSGQQRSESESEAVGHETRSQAEQLELELEQTRRFRAESRAWRAAYAAAGPAPLCCSAPGCLWSTPQGVAHLPTMVELIRLHTQVAHPAVGSPGGGGWVVGSQGGTGGGVVGSQRGTGGGVLDFQGERGGEEVNHPSGGPPPPPSYEDLSDQIYKPC